MAEDGEEKNSAQQPSLTKQVARAVAIALGRSLRWSGRRVQARAVTAVGGPARARVIFLFGGVLALASADTSTIGAVAPQLESQLHIGNTEVGLLSSVTLLIGAVAVIPVGLMVDKINRVHMLSISIVLWSVAMLLSGASGSYQTLLLTRLALGAVSATAGPAIASLTGDYFYARERGRVYGYILGGEVAGTAVGFIVSGAVASILSWRFAFWVIAIPGFFLARELWRTLPEPRRGGMSRLDHGTVDLFAAARGQDRPEPTEGDPDIAIRDDDLAQEAARNRGIEPDPRLVLTEDPAQMSLKRAFRYIMGIPSNVTMIIASALGYFFFAGLQTFAVLFVRAHYHASQGTATLVLALLVAGALAGVLISGRLTDALLRRGVLNARVYVPAVSYIAAAALLIPGILATKLTPAVWFDVGGAALLSAANPPLDAARLDIMPAGLWGRAESVRTLFRTLAQAIAPILFGLVADLVAGITPSQTPIGTKPKSSITSGTANGLEYSFLLMLIVLGAAGVILLRARQTYPRDVATAAASSVPTVVVDAHDAATEVTAPKAPD
ncbi:MAG TPA: MFS transporter [Solirubrobacteraceae bacterium]|nr:MFS transporter [Solirubrobacteraceae bacterium]